ncbi:MAG TPA: glutamate--cysteine ligase [Jatrophihabitans sp.]|nr:glutamate--cysteine ligase [Jatrophihabitans sp.]
MKIRQVGVEEEFLLFDVNAPRLLDIGPDVVAAAERDGADEAQFEKELKRAQAELASDPADHPDALAADLARARAELAKAAGEKGARLVASGTCPVPGSTQTTDDPRYRQMADRFAELERRQLTCAMHVHVEIEDAEEGVDVLNGVAPWLAVLAALTANSPYRDGRDTGYASYRRVVWDDWPTAGVTARFADAGDYRRTVDELIATGAARDDGMIYFDARLSANYPTVEIRVCDVCIDIEDAVTIAALCRALVSTAADAPFSRTTRPELLRAAAWRAARWGMTDQLVDLSRRAHLKPAWAVVHALVERVSPALIAAGDVYRVREGLERIRELGTGAERQRAAVADADHVAAAVQAATVRTD